MPLTKVKPMELLAVRVRLLKEQGSACAICRQPLAESDAVADHCHTTGEIRGILHRGCNSMLGKFENHRRIAKLTNIKAAAAWAAGLVAFLHKPEYTGLMYPTHKTADEKRVARNAKARRTRAANKKVTTP